MTGTGKLIQQLCMSQYAIIAQQVQPIILEKLSSIEDRDQTDRGTALPRPYALDIDL